MKNDTLEVLEKVKSGEMPVEEALLKLKKQPFDDIGFAKIDYHRSIRQGANEVIYGKGKTREQILAIAQKMLENGITNILVTRIKKDVFEFLSESVKIDYCEIAEFAVIERQNIELVGNVVVVSAGTSDMAVCEEASLTLEAMGNKVTRIYDAGVAGLHRLLSHLDELMSARVIVAVAGMEGALASVVGGLVDCPVIAVPTSVGYGANFGGLSALLSMLNSCSSGISVVNIDNGFGGGYLAGMINKIGETK
ncbi:MAG: nickel pincer cofactor biosynthesis protein LarB [Clostridia bacterium]